MDVTSTLRTTCTCADSGCSPCACVPNGTLNAGALGVQLCWRGFVRSLGRSDQAKAKRQAVASFDYFILELRMAYVQRSPIIVVLDLASSYPLIAAEAVERGLGRLMQWCPRPSPAVLVRFGASRAGLKCVLVGGFGALVIVSPRHNMVHPYLTTEQRLGYAVAADRLQQFFATIGDE